MGSSLNGCGRSGAGMVPGEDRPQHVLKAGPPRCAPSIPEVLRESESPLPPIPSMEGRSMPDGHTFQPHSVPLWVLSALHLRRVWREWGAGRRRRVQLRFTKNCSPPALPRVAELCRTKPLRGRGRGVHCGRALPAAA